MLREGTSPSFHGSQQPRLGNAVDRNKSQRARFASSSMESPWNGHGGPWPSHHGFHPTAHRGSHPWFAMLDQTRTKDPCGKTATKRREDRSCSPCSRIHSGASPSPRGRCTASNSTVLITVAVFGLRRPPSAVYDTPRGRRELNMRETTPVCRRWNHRAHVACTVTAIADYGSVAGDPAREAIAAVGGCHAPRRQRRQAAGRGSSRLGELARDRLAGHVTWTGRWGPRAGTLPGHVEHGWCRKRGSPLGPGLIVRPKPEGNSWRGRMFEATCRRQRG
jgi:hypothetical protein